MQVTAQMLKELFSVPMSTLPGHDQTIPPVREARVDTTGKFAGRVVPHLGGPLCPLLRKQATRLFRGHGYVCGVAALTALGGLRAGLA